MPTYQPLTPEQFQKARSAGFSTQQIISNEQKRKGQSAVTPAAQPQSLGDKIMGGLKGFTDFIGAKGITDYAASKIAESSTKSQQEKDILKAGEPSAKEVAGSVIQVGSLAFPYGEAARGASLGLKALGLGAKALETGKGVEVLGKGSELVSPLVKKLGQVTSGAAGGYGVDVGANLQNGQSVPQSLTPGLGTAIGAGIPLVPPLLGAAARGVGESLGVSTGAGYGAVKEALNASTQGGERATAFTDALRGRTPPEAIVQEARDSLGQIVDSRNKAYQGSLEKLQTKTKEFDTTPIAEKFNKMLTDYGVEVGENGADFSRAPGLGRYEKDLTQLSQTIKNWGSKPGDLTISGIDKLKQTIDDFRIGSADARKFDSFVTALRNEAKSLGKNEPEYQKMLKGYEESTGLIKEIKRGLSVGDKAQTDTAFRKLTTALRTNNEFRKELIGELDKASGGFLSSKIAGQQLSEALPRGLARQIEGFGAAGTILTGGSAALLPLLKVAAFASPRIVGEIVNALGISRRVFNQVLDHISGGGRIFPGDIAANALRGSSSPKGLAKLGAVSAGAIGSTGIAAGAALGSVPSKLSATTQTPEATYKLTGRGVSLTESDIEELRNVLFAEISNRDPDKQELEARTIVNTALNRIAQYQKKGKDFSVSQVLKQPNQYQGYNSKEYNRAKEGGLRQTDEQKLNAIDVVLDQLKSGDFPDTTEGSVFYTHDTGTGRIKTRDGELYSG